MAGATDFRCLRVTGHHAKQLLQILIDSESTHNFIDTNVATKLGCKITPVAPMLVRIADGRQAVQAFQWKMNGPLFSVEMYLLPIGSCDVVLGIHWLSFLGDIYCNFQQLTMVFYH